MITILIIMISAIVYEIRKEYISRYYLTDIFDYVMRSIIGCVYGFAIGSFIAFLLPMDTQYIEIKTPMMTISDNNSVKGQFFLGSGHVNGDMKYVYYYESDGFYKMNQVDYDKAKIRYTSSHPSVTICYNKPTKSFINRFALDFNVFDRNYIFDIPKGSIINNYKLDAQ